MPSCECCDCTFHCARYVRAACLSASVCEREQNQLLLSSFTCSYQIHRGRSSLIVVTILSRATFLVTTVHSGTCWKNRRFMFRLSNASNTASRRYLIVLWPIRMCGITPLIRHVLTVRSSSPRLRASSASVLSSPPPGRLRFFHCDLGFIFLRGLLATTSSSMFFCCPGSCLFLGNP